MAASFPVITITGPRQSGKTTLAKMTFPDKEYVTLEDMDTREFALSDPRAFLDRYSDGAIIDEVQHVPPLLSYIQTIVDRKNRPGMFVLTGSNQFQSMQNITQSLAGRTGVLKLLPFSFDEIREPGKSELNELLFTGFYPRIFDQKIRPEFFHAGYVETYVERDVRMMVKVKDLMRFHGFVKLCAGRTGQILNSTSLANDIGVTGKTISEWISILEASFIIFLLKPYYNNFNKRIIKSPKLYFIDAGLAAHLLGIEKSDQMETHPLRGQLFETFVVSEFLKQRLNRGLRDNLYYFRDRTGNEVDLILETGLGPVPVEIKSSKTVSRHFFKGLDYFKGLSGTAPASCLVMGRDMDQKRTPHRVIGYSRIGQFYADIG